MYVYTENEKPSKMTKRTASTAFPVSDGATERYVATQLLDKDDPSRLSWKEIQDGWGSNTNFMLSHGLKPSNPADVANALEVSRALKEPEHSDDDDEDHYAESGAEGCTGQQEDDYESVGVSVEIDGDSDDYEADDD